MKTTLFAVTLLAAVMSSGGIYASEVNASANADFERGLAYDNGKGVSQDYAQAAAWYRKAAEQGHADAQYNLGVLYYNGQGVPQDYQQAYAWSSVAAANGHTDAVTSRDIMATRLTPAMLGEAKALATRYFERTRPK